MLRASTLYRKCEGNEQLTLSLLLGDGANTSTWLVKPYPSNIHLTDTQKKFNKFLSSPTVIVERRFGLLKGRWHCLLKKLDSDIEYVRHMILSWFVLHKITQIRGDKDIDYENLLDIIICDGRNTRFRRHQYSNGFQENAELRDVLAQHVAGIKKKTS